jgi:uncharacterized protein (UPF0332 family)
MGVKWTDFELNGNEILSNSKEERHYREVTRNYYYSLFHLLDSLKEGQNIPKNTGSHQALCQILMNYKGSKEPYKYKRLGQELSALRKLRIHADYLLDKDFTKEDMKKAMNKQSNIKNFASQLNII